MRIGILFWVVLVGLFFVPNAIAQQSTTRPWDAGAEVGQFLAEEDFGKSVDILMRWEKLDLESRMKLLDELAKHLESTEYRPPVNTADMVVVSRLGDGPGKMQFHGHGLMLQQDVFIVGGKAAFAIERLVDAQGPAILEKMEDEGRKQAVWGVKNVIRAYQNGVLAGREKKG